MHGAVNLLKNQQRTRIKMLPYIPKFRGHVPTSLIMIVVFRFDAPLHFHWQVLIPGLGLEKQKQKAKAFLFLLLLFTILFFYYYFFFLLLFL